MKKYYSSIFLILSFFEIMMTGNIKHIIEYLEQLSMNNNRERFHEEKNQDRYKESRKQFLGIVEGLYDGIQEFDKTLRGVEIKQMIFRINRDMRFSKDKSPYKQNFGASITRNGGKKSQYAGYYFHIQPGNYSFIAGGLYRPEKEALNAMRLHLEYEGNKFNKIISNKLFTSEFKELMGRSLVRPPRGYTEDTPYINLIKMKDWYVVRYFKDSEVIKDDFMKKFLESAKVLSPFNKFINSLLEDVYL